MVLEELVQLWSRLTDNDPDRYEAWLARALDNLAHRHEEDGAPQEAVEATVKSADAYRRAVGRDPQSHEPELALALTNLNIRQYDTGSPDAAVTSGREPLAITRRLAAADPDAYRPLTSYEYSPPYYAWPGRTQRRRRAATRPAPSREKRLQTPNRNRRDDRPLAQATCGDFPGREPRHPPRSEQFELPLAATLLN
ncbi:hypothetical protein [Streptomyces fulvoviolaceus]|uniref:hypothetical protein n=1 Tax=Streptomyces fulvoviolaceus TaxID=285535 RepID=UPI0021BE02D6|nr:hypothetical protein [Streptomyces fulvoviolaceus]MCT9082189.1 hypothetical protein [Streptomyces fulvoviolaceus]